MSHSLPLTLALLALAPAARAQVSDTTQVREATVTAYRPVAKVISGGTQTAVEGTPLAKLGSAEDMLKEIPGVIAKTDKDGGFEVIGKGTPLIYINGRQVRDLKELKQLRSEDVKSVDVLTTPGARYDASVSAVIRIRTVKRRGEGFGLIVSDDFHQGRYAHNDATAQLTYRHGGLELFSGGSYNVEKNLWDSDNTQLTEAPDTLWSIPMHTHQVSKIQGFSFNAGLNYDLSEHQSFGLRYELSSRPRVKFSALLSSRILINGLPYDTLESSLHTDIDDDLTHKLNAYYTGRIGKGTLQIDADYYGAGSTDRTANDEQSAEHDDRAFVTTSRERSRLLSGKASYEWPWLGGQVTLGGQYTFTNRHDNYGITDTSFGLTPTLSHQREQTAAAFVEYSRTLGTRHRLSAGLRYEHATYEYYLNEVKDHDLSPTYDNLFPTLSYSTMLGNDPQRALQLMASYSATIDRPGYGLLSNSVTYGNRFLYQSGNSSLKPTLQHSASLTAVWRFLQATAAYTYFRDGIVSWGTSIPDRPGTTLLQPANHDLQFIFFRLTAAPQWGWYRPTWTVAYNQCFLTLESMGRKRRYDSPRFIANLSNVFELPRKWRIGVTYRFGSPGDMQNIKLVGCTHDLSAYVQRTLLGDALTVTLGGEDLVNRTWPTIRMDMASSRFVQFSKGDSRNVYLKLTYQLNPGKSRYKGQSSADDVIKRL